MAGITVTKEKGCLRIYRTFSYRDSNNKPQRVRKALGKIDPKTGKFIFNNFFRELILKQNLSLETISKIPYHEIPSYVDFGTCTKQQIISRNENLGANEDYVTYNRSIKDHDSINQLNKTALNIETCDGKKYTFIEQKSSYKGVGSKFILDVVLGQTGLLNILSKALPLDYDKIITLAFYLVSDRSLDYSCQDWLNNNECMIENSSLLSPNGIEKLFYDIKKWQIVEFWKLWTDHISETEYLALDITSSSSCTNLINELEYDNNLNDNKEHDFNFCLLFGQKSGLPTFSSSYDSSLDVSKNLRSFLEKLKLFGDKKYKLVLDIDFFSESNLNYLLNKQQNCDFMISVPLTNKIFQNIILQYKEKLESESTIGYDNIISAYSFIDKIDKEKSVIYHALFNKNKYIDINFKTNKETIYYAGWLIVVSNDLNSAYKDALSFFRKKNIVEKSFKRIKKSLAFNGIASDVNNLVDSRLFVAMISLIVSSYIDKIMVNTGLDLKYSLTQMLNKLDTLKIDRSQDLPIISPITEKVRYILEAFEIIIR
jgi:hypothetical protein